MSSSTLRSTERGDIGRYFESGGHNFSQKSQNLVNPVQKCYVYKRLLSSLKQPSDPSSPKIYINPNLSPDDKFHQIKVLQAFNKLKFAGEDNKSSFSVYPQGFAVKIVCDAKQYFYSFDSKKSPKEFLRVVISL